MNIKAPIPLTVQPVQGNELVLTGLGNKLVAGKELTNPEKLMGITGVNQDSYQNDPNSPQNFSVHPIDLSPTYLGEIISHAT